MPTDPDMIQVGTLVHSRVDDPLRFDPIPDLAPPRPGIWRRVLGTVARGFMYCFSDSDDSSTGTADRTRL